MIENHFGDGREWGVSIRYCRESSPLGTAGALKEIEDCLGDDFLVFYGDMVMNVDLGELARFHARHKPLATLVVHPNNHPEESDLVELDATDASRPSIRSRAAASATIATARMPPST